MAKCWQCGNRGLFLHVNEEGLCNNCAKAQKKMQTEVKKQLLKDPKYRKMEEDLAYQDKLLKLALKARDHYKVDGDCDKAIAEYEKVMIQAKPPLKSNAHAMFLADLYIKAGYNDKAWGYLNSLILSHGLDLDKIRKYQAQILKKENKHDEAIKMLMLHHLAKSEWNNTLNREMFLKDIAPSIKKLGWSNDDVEALADMVANQVKSKNYKEGTLIDKYKTFIREHS